MNSSSWSVLVIKAYRVCAAINVHLRCRKKVSLISSMAAQALLLLCLMKTLIPKCHWLLGLRWIALTVATDTAKKQAASSSLILTALPIL